MESGSEPTLNYVSQRAMRALRPIVSYRQAFAAAQGRQWSESDPEGNIICSVAENKLTADMLHAKMVSVQQDVPVSTMSYPSNFKGSLEARQVVAHMMKRTFMKGVDVQADHLALLAGAGACLDLLFWCLAAPGEGVLLPSPIYPAFVNDMEVRGACHLVLFELDEGRGVAEQMDLAAAGAKAEGHPIKIMILANPNNPMGIVYKRDTVRDILHWCLKNHVHFISDEIYALSVWGEGGPEFVSTEVVAQQEAAEGTFTPAQLDLIPQLLHTVCGLSKDFCASGLRVGVLHTRNPTLMKAVDNLCYFHTCSAPMIWTMSQILTDDVFMDAFIAENKKRMRSAYQGLADGLDQAGIPYVRAMAAMFCWVDLRAGLKEPGWEGERELWRALIEVGVLLTPGEACRASAPGFFRICWAWCPAAALPHAARRMGQLLDQRRTQQNKDAAVTRHGTD